MLKKLLVLFLYLGSLVVPQKVFGESAIVEGDINKLIPLAYTRYLDGYPAVFFSAKQGERGFDLLNKVENIVVTESLDSLILDMLKDKYKVSFTKEGEGVIKVASKDVYEIWLNMEEARNNIITTTFSLTVDDKKFSMQQADSRRIKDSGKRWLKLGDLEIAEGRHNIKVDKKIDRIPLVLIIPRALRSENRKHILDTIEKHGIRLAHMFSFFRDKKDESQLRETEPKIVDFIVDKENTYEIKAKLKPLLYREKSSVLAMDLSTLKIADMWSFKPINTIFERSTTTDGLLLKAFFDGDSKEDEYVGISNILSLWPLMGNQIDLIKYPYFEMTYKVEDPQVQTIEVVAGIDTSGDGKADLEIKGKYPSPASTFFSKFSLNLLEIARAMAPDKNQYNLVRLELYPHKLWGVDCRGEKRKLYGFWIKEVEFFNYDSDEKYFSIKDGFHRIIENGFVADFKSVDEINKWTISSKAADYGLIKIESGITLARGFLKFLELFREVGRINLENFPYLMLNIRRESSDLEELEILLRIDSGKQHPADISAFITRFQDYKWMRIDVDLLKEIKKIYSYEGKYHLLGIILRLKGKFKIEKEDFDSKNIFTINDLKIYGERKIPKEKLVAADIFTFDGPLLKIDGKEYRYKKSFKSKSEAEEAWLDIPEINLRKGSHHLEVLPNDNFRVELLLLEGRRNRDGKLLSRNSGGDAKSSGKGAIINFRKVNPTRYVVSASADKPFWLVFSESFHEGWKAYTRQSGMKNKESGVEDKKQNMSAKEPFEWSAVITALRDKGKRIELKDHFMVNAYANAWYVDLDKLKDSMTIKSGKGGKKEFEIILEFKPQRLFEIGIVISLTTLSLCITYLVYDSIKRRRNKNNIRKSLINS